MFCSQFFDDVSFGRIPSAWEDDVERFPNVLNFTLYHIHRVLECFCVLTEWWIQFISDIWKFRLISLCDCHLPSVHVSFCFVFFILHRVPALPGMEERDDKNAAEEKKRAYQLDLQRQVCVFTVPGCYHMTLLNCCHYKVLHLLLRSLWAYD